MMSSSNRCDGSNKVLPQIRCTPLLEPQDQECMATEPAVLPDDVLVEVLRRLASHNLAACRWVCKAWHDIVHDHLRSRLLSHSVRGIFINYTSHHMSEFYSRPSTGPAICGGLDFLPGNGVKVTDHCNGLLLCSNWKHEYVVNPATQRWARLPQYPPPHMPGFHQTAYLAFDHAVSPHYEVYLIPYVPQRELGHNASPESEWPPASHVMHVFSSATERWDEKTFLREGKTAGVLADISSSRSWRGENCAVYWRGALYVLHTGCDFVMRMCLSNYKYQVIKMPGHLGLCPTQYLGRSMRGVYCAILFHTYQGLQLWHLDEPCGQMKWVLKHDVNLKSFGRKFYLRGDDEYSQQMDKHWILQDVNYRRLCCYWYGPSKCGDYKAPTEDKFEWNSDDDNILDIEHATEERWSGYIGFLGFHPYKEIVFLNVSLDGAVAYDWNSSKFQYLGRIAPKDYREIAMQCAGIDTCFPYTPCWMYEFPSTSLESQLEDDEQLSGNSSESQVEDHPPFTDSVAAHEYELRKLRRHVKRANDSNAKVRRRRRIAARLGTHLDRHDVQGRSHERGKVSNKELVPAIAQSRLFDEYSYSESNSAHCNLNMTSMTS